MKNFLLALMVVLTTCTLAVAQTTVVRDSIGKVKVTVTKDNKANTNNTAVTVIGVDTADADSADVNANSSNVSTTHGKASFTFDSDDSDFPFHNVSAGGGILVAIIAIIAVFGFPVFILFVIFFFRYKNRKARYRLAEQALAAGQPLPAEFIRENKTVDSRSQGIKNTFTGIGLFIFLWAITGEFGIGAIGLLVTFMGASLGRQLFLFLSALHRSEDNQSVPIPASWHLPDHSPLCRVLLPFLSSFPEYLSVRK